jgi:hypothetical protein
MMSFGVVAQGTDIIIGGAGELHNNLYPAINKFGYWKNGLWVELPGQMSGTAFTPRISRWLALYQNNIAAVATGRYWGDLYLGFFFNPVFTGTQWWSSVDGSKYNRIFGVATEGSKIIYYGAYYPLPTYGYPRNGLLFDGMLVIELENFVPNTGAIHNGSIILGGYSNSDRGYFPAIWRDGVVEVLPGLINANSSGGQVFDISILNGQVRAVGETDGYPAYWKNGTAIQLHNQSGHMNAGFISCR